MNQRGRSKDERAQYVARWRASGRTATEFGAEHGLTAGTLYAWARDLKAAAREAAAPQAAAREPTARGPAFVEVRATDSRRHPASGGVVEVLLGGGRVVRVVGVVEPDVLRSVVEVLESC